MQNLNETLQNLLPLTREAPGPNGPRNYDGNYILWWNNIALDLNRLVHTILGGPNQGPPISARALAIFHIAIHDAYFSIVPGTTKLGSIDTYLKPLPPHSPTSSSASARAAVAGAAVKVLDQLYRLPVGDPSISTKGNELLHFFLDRAATEAISRWDVDASSSGYKWGQLIGSAIMVHPQASNYGRGAIATGYKPRSTVDYFFDDDPLHPVRLFPVNLNDPEGAQKVTRPYHAPFYGSTALPLATTQNHLIADPPVNPHDPPVNPHNPSTHSPPALIDYLESLEDVHRMGGVNEDPNTLRTPAQTAGGIFWAYDGVKLIGTPPRLYNQIIRQIAYDKTKTAIDSDANNEEFLRLLTLANVAMADAGIYCWRDKYKYELWRPLSGVRQDPSGPVPGGFSRPTWRSLGAPATNTNETGFKPPFPAYPSGHATFGAACFQIARRFFAKLYPQDVELSTQAELPKDVELPNRAKLPDHHKIDNICFTFVSDELNGQSRILEKRHDPMLPITDQPGEVRTYHPRCFDSLWQAIFENGMSRIWLGVHWHFDAAAGNDMMLLAQPGSSGSGLSEPRPAGYKEKFQTHGTNGSTLYRPYGSMNFFHTRGSRGGGPDEHPYGGIPLGIMIADDIWEHSMEASTLGPLGEGPPVRA